VNKELRETPPWGGANCPPPTGVFMPLTNGFPQQW